MAKAETAIEITAKMQYITVCDVHTKNVITPRFMFGHEVIQGEGGKWSLVN